VITLRSPEELVKLRAANQLVASILAELRRMAVPGATTAEIDAEAERLVRAAGAEPAFKGYRGFPGTICAFRRTVHWSRATSSRWTWA
jgi:methionyl aminopeptidase